MSAPRSPTHLYDAIVLGGDLAGLVAGALLAKRGARVLLAPAGARPGHVEDGGFALPTRVNLLPSPKQLPALHAVLEELGLMPTVGRSITPHPTGLQLLFPDARLDWAPERDARRAELERAFGSGAVAWEKALFANELPITTWLQAAALLPTLGLRDAFALRKPARTLLREAEGGGDLGRLDQVVAGLGPLLSPADGGAVGRARVLLPLLAQPCGVEGSRLADELRSYILSKRGEAIDAPVDEVVVERGAFVGVRFQGLAAPHRGNLALAALPPDRLGELIEAPRPRAKIEKLAFPHGATLHTHHWVTKEEALPPGLGPAALLVGFDGPPVLLGVESTRQANGVRASGRLTFTATACLPREQDAAAAAAAIGAVVEEVLPFLDRHLVHEHHLAVGPAQLEPPKPGALGVEGLPLRSPIRHLVWASAQVLPGLGIEGELLAGTRAANAADELRRKG